MFSSSGVPGDANQADDPCNARAGGSTFLDDELLKGVFVCVYVHLEVLVVVP